MEPIAFTATSDYQTIKVFGKAGVYTPENIDAASLPTGFYKYNLIPGDETLIDALTSKDTIRFSGSLITKEPITLRWNKKRSVTDSDWDFTDEDFDFQSFFGKKLGIDAQIHLAEAKRELLVEERDRKKRSKSRGRKASR